MVPIPNFDFLKDFLLGRLLDNWKTVISHFIKKEFLDESIKQLKECYVDEVLVHDKIPYVLISEFYKGDSQGAFSITKNIKLSLERSRFQLQNDSNPILQKFQLRALEAFRDRLTNNGSIVRLSNYTLKDGNLTDISMQHAQYHDQVKSNLVLDWKGHRIPEFTTLRSHIKSTYKCELPPLSSTILANTIGISCILYYKSGKQYFPYLPQRAKFKIGPNAEKSRVALFEGGFHATASGALDFPQSFEPGKELNFHDLFTKKMYDELDEEVGIKKEDIVELVPLALTRELLRAGKPQIFFGGILKDNITENELTNKRVEAIRIQKKSRDTKVEVENRALSLSNYENITSEAMKHGLTLEALGNLYFSDKYISYKQ